MLFAGSKLRIIDNSGIKFIKCIRIINSSNKKNAKVGDIITGVIVNVNTNSSFLLQKKKSLSKFLKGNLQRVLLVRSKFFFMRAPGSFIRFSDNAGILISKNNIPLARRIRGPVPIELCKRYPSLGTISNVII